MLSYYISTVHFLFYGIVKHSMFCCGLVLCTTPACFSTFFIDLLSSLLTLLKKVWLLKPRNLAPGLDINAQYYMY